MLNAKRKIIIMGAAGRDFHNFNTLYRDNPSVEVVAFTATQIPDIQGRQYPAVLAGKLYPKGIPIYDEKELVDLIKKHKVDEVIFSYSDVSHHYVMEKGAYVMAAGGTVRARRGRADHDQIDQTGGGGLCGADRQRQVSDHAKSGGGADGAGEESSGDSSPHAIRRFEQTDFTAFRDPQRSGQTRVHD